jgi:hypothetical protein
MIAVRLQNVAHNLGQRRGRFRKLLHYQTWKVARLSIAERAPKMRFHVSTKTTRRRGRGRKTAVDRIAPRRSLVRMPESGAVQRLLVPEMVVHSRNVRLCAVTDLGDRGVTVALFGKDIAGGFQQAPPCFGSVCAFSDHTMSFCGCFHAENSISNFDFKYRFEKSDCRGWVYVERLWSCCFPRVCVQVLRRGCRCRTLRGTFTSRVCQIRGADQDQAPGLRPGFILGYLR